MPTDYKARYRAYLETEHWRTLRADLFEIRGCHCAICSANEQLDAHHLAYRNLTDCTPDDLMPLCRPCHELVHSWHSSGLLNRRWLQAKPYPERVKILQQLRRDQISALRRLSAIRNGVTLNTTTLAPKKNRTHFRVLTPEEYKRI